MRVLRALLGSVLWILACVLGLVGVLLCVTVILLPLGIPVVMLARKLFKYSMVFFIPRKARHPLQETGKSVKGSLGEATGKASAPNLDLKQAKKAGKELRGTSQSFVKRLRKRLA